MVLNANVSMYHRNCLYFLFLEWHMSQRLEQLNLFKPKINADLAKFNWIFHSLALSCNLFFSYVPKGARTLEALWGMPLQLYSAIFHAHFLMLEKFSTKNFVRYFNQKCVISHCVIGVGPCKLYFFNRAWISFNNWSL